MSGAGLEPSGPGSLPHVILSSSRYHAPRGPLWLDGASALAVDLEHLATENTRFGANESIPHISRQVRFAESGFCDVITFTTPCS